MRAMHDFATQDRILAKQRPAKRESLRLRLEVHAIQAALQVVEQVLEKNNPVLKHGVEMSRADSER